MKQLKVLVFGLALSLCGCGQLPSVQLSAHKSPLHSGFRFFSNKDDTYAMKGVKSNPKTGDVEIESLDIRHNSPAVIAADAARMDKYIELHRVLGYNVALGIATGGEAGERIIRAATGPFLGANLSLDTPIGSGSLTTGSGVPVSPTTKPVASQPTSDGQLEIR